MRRNNKEDETEEKGKRKNKREEIQKIEWRKLEAENGIKLNVYLF